MKWNRWDTCLLHFYFLSSVFQKTIIQEHRRFWVYLWFDSLEKTWYLCESRWAKFYFLNFHGIISRKIQLWNWWRQRKQKPAQQFVPVRRKKVWRFIHFSIIRNVYVLAIKSDSFKRLKEVYKLMLNTPEKIDEIEHSRRTRSYPPFVEEKSNKQLLYA
jgi:hypothetical protein